MVAGFSVALFRLNLRRNIVKYARSEFIGSNRFEVQESSLLYLIVDSLNNATGGFVVVLEFALLGNLKKGNKT